MNEYEGSICLSLNYNETKAEGNSHAVILMKNGNHSTRTKACRIIIETIRQLQSVNSLASLVQWSHSNPVLAVDINMASNNQQGYYINMTTTAVI